MYDHMDLVFIEIQYLKESGSEGAQWSTHWNVNNKNNHNLKAIYVLYLYLWKHCL